MWGWWRCQWLTLHIVLGQNLPLSLWAYFQPSPRALPPLLPPCTLSSDQTPSPLFLSTEDRAPAVTLTSWGGTGLCKAVVVRSSTGFKPLQRNPWHPGACTAVLSLVFGCAAAALSSSYVASSTKTDKPQPEGTGVKYNQSTWERWIRQGNVFGIRSRRQTQGPHCRW